MKKILESLEEKPLPLDVVMGNYFRFHKAIGSKDKKFISDAIYGIIRWKGLIDAHCIKPVTWEKRVEWYLSHDIQHVLKNSTHAPHVKVSFPKNFFDLLHESYGESKAVEICLACNEPAPTAIRVNSLKTSRDALLKKWESTFSVSPLIFADQGIRFHKKVNFFGMEEYKTGLFEVQDEASQLIANLVCAKPGMKILDFCAGAGGKTLAFAPAMLNKGVVYLHDVREKALLEAKKRLQRAGVQNVQFCLAGDPKLKDLTGKMDLILLDVPCSGSGTLRRNPDLKWKFSNSNLQELLVLQRKIFEDALLYLSPNGKILYSTCSILPQENEKQIQFFEEAYHYVLEGSPFQSLPKSGEMDGFFGAVLSKKPEVC